MTDAIPLLGARDLDTCLLATLGIDEHDVGRMDRHHLFDDLTLAACRSWALVTLGLVESVQNDHILLGKCIDDGRGLPLAFAGDHYNFVTFL